MHIKFRNTNPSHALDHAASEGALTRTRLRARAAPTQLSALTMMPKPMLPKPVLPVMQARPVTRPLATIKPNAALPATAPDEVSCDIETLQLQEAILRSFSDNLSRPSNPKQAMSQQAHEALLDVPGNGDRAFLNNTKNVAPQAAEPITPFRRLPGEIRDVYKNLVKSDPSSRHYSGSMIETLAAVHYAAEVASTRTVPKQIDDTAAIQPTRVVQDNGNATVNKVNSLVSALLQYAIGDAREGLDRHVRRFRALLNHQPRQWIKPGKDISAESAVTRKLVNLIDADKYLPRKLNVCLVSVDEHGHPDFENILSSKQQQAHAIYIADLGEYYEVVKFI
ncbi:hypothetical protein [Paraburkholderia humisilvae]|uniref:Uncharacterized protein n=1 Tax=Paraburkholderia humisilvae TaxID=627669 RepID=A0A6J5F1B7_9BURK|nr:hypothetical protein [Paraburkholderia humisilvae]CAB3772640.1 hypothetical protein LMG29542_06932 [Paraburkholderia humisilvae]